MESSLIIDQLLSLDKMGLHNSCSILSDILLFNPSLLPQYSVGRRQVLVVYANSLYNDEQYKRALVYYRQALTCETDSNEITSEDIKVSNIKWNIYKCLIKLKEYQESLDTLLSIPVKERSVQMELCLAKLYHHFKNDNCSAVVYYRMVLMQCPFVVEAAVAMLRLGTPLAQLTTIFKQHQTSLININWINIWLKAQEHIAFYQYTDAVKEFDSFTKLGYTLSPEMNSQAAWCMSKLLRKQVAVELFGKARIQDQYILKHIDTYGRLLATKSSASQLEKLAHTLLSVSSLHVEPWIVFIWNTARSNKSTSPRLQILIDKLEEIPNPLDYTRPEKGFLLGTIGLTKRNYMSSILYFQEAIKTDPSFFEAHESMLRCSSICRGYKATYSAMISALKSIKIPVQQLYLEAVVLSNRSETESKARQCLENAVKIDNTFEKASIALCNLYKQEKNITKAIDMLNGVLEHYQSPSLHYELGKCFQLTKQFSDAIQQYELTLRMDPEHRDSMNNLLQLQEGIDNHQLENDENEMEEGLNDDYFGDSLVLARDLNDGDISILDYDGHQRDF